MKRISALLLALVMMLSLCACSNNQATDPSGSSQSTTAGTEKPTDGTEGTTGATQTPTDEPTTAPTDEPSTAPTDEPTTPPTQAPTTPPETQPAACSHSWKAATCTAAKTCSLCGATEGNAAGHSWTAATCTTPKTCKTCNATEGNAAGHSWNAATCIAPKTCKACGITEGSKGDHTYTNGVCSVCGATSVLNPKTDLSTDEYVGNFNVYGAALIGAGIQMDGETLLVLDRYFTSEPDEEDGIYTPIVYKGKEYYSMGAGQHPHYYELTDTEIVVKGRYWDCDDPDAVTIKLILQGDGMLKVTYSTNQNFPVGTILSTNINDVLK